MMKGLEMLGSLAWFLPMLGLTHFSVEGDGGGSGGGTGTALTGGGEGGEGEIDWREQIPEDIRGEGIFANVKDVGDLATQFVNAQKMVGADKILKPRDDWKEDDWNKFYNELGRPETAEKYQKPETKLAEGMEMSDEVMGEALKLFHKSGLTQKQSNEVFGFYIDLINGQVESATQESQKTQREAVESLKNDFGDKYDENLDVAQSVVKKFGDEELIKFLDESGIGDSPLMIKLFAKIGGSLIEDTAVGTGKGLDLTTQTGAKQEIAKLTGDEDFQKMMNDRTHPGHADAVIRWENLHKQVHGTEIVK